jgi:hypothetical protein
VASGRVVTSGRGVRGASSRPGHVVASGRVVALCGAAVAGATAVAGRRGQDRAHRAACGARDGRGAGSDPPVGGDRGSCAGVPARVAWRDRRRRRKGAGARADAKGAGRRGHEHALGTLDEISSLLDTELVERSAGRSVRRDSSLSDSETRRTARRAGVLDAIPWLSDSDLVEWLGGRNARRGLATIRYGTRRTVRWPKRSTRSRRYPIRNPSNGPVAEALDAISPLSNTGVVERFGGRSRRRTRRRPRERLVA